MTTGRTRRTERKSYMERSTDRDKAFHVRACLLELLTEEEWGGLDNMAEPQGDRTFWQNCEIGALANCIQRVRAKEAGPVRMTRAERAIVFGGVE